MARLSCTLVCVLFVLLASASPTRAATYRGVGDLPLFGSEDQSLSDRTGFKVNVASGNLLVQTVDLSIAGTGVSLDLTRSYNNLDHAFDGDAGHGQMLGVGGRVRIVVQDAGATAMVRGPSGYEVPFRKNADGTWRTPLGFNATLTRAADNTWSMRFHGGGERWNFHSDGYLASIRDQNNNAIVVNYDSTRLVTSITDSQGRSVNFTHTADRDVATITDPLGRRITYGYANADLTSVTDATGKITRYDFGPSGGTGDLLQITDPRGNATKFEYDAGHRVTKVVRVTDSVAGTGPTTTFRYATGDSRCPAGTTSTVVTDPRSNPTVFCIDSELRVNKTVDAAGRSRSSEYDSNSNVIKFTDSLANLTTATFDSDSRIEGGKSPSGYSFAYGYQAATAGKGADYYYPRSFTSPAGDATDFTYDANGNLKTATDRATQKGVTLDYNPNGTVSKVTDARSNVTTLGYDTKGNMTSVTPPSPLGAQTFGYDAVSRLSTSRDGKLQTRTFTYDNLDRPTKLTLPDGTAVSFVYDANGNMTSRTDLSGTTTYVYDALNRQTKKTLPTGRTVAYTYDAAGNMLAFTDSGGTTTYTYNNLNLVDSATEPGGHRTTFAYNESDRRTRTTFPNGVVETRTYDTASRVQTIGAKNAAGTTLTSYSYDYRTAAGADRALRQSVTDKNGDKTSYTYDTLDRLTRAVTTNGTTTRRDHRYTYDPAGNRTREQEMVAGTDVTSVYNGANQLTSRGSVTYTYDANGNQTGSSDGRTYGYNALDQMTKYPGNTYTYAGVNQFERVRAVGIGYDYAYNNTLIGMTALTGADYNGYYLRDPGGEVLGFRDPSRYYYLKDGLGSVVGYVNSSGTLVRSYKYDPYGNEISGAPTPQYDQAWRFAGQWGQSDAGLYKMGTRWYDPKTGRWTQQDPIYAAGDLQQGNRYVYASSDPVNVVDPLGMFSIGIDVEVQLGPVRLSGGVSLDDDGNLGVSGGVGGGQGVGGGVKGTVNPFGKVQNGGEIEGGGCASPTVVGPSACLSASSRGGMSAGIGGGTEAGIAYRETRRVADLW